MKRYSSSLVLRVLFLCAETLCATAAVGCRNARGELVDWWAALKPPSGALYVYVDSTQPSYKFTYDPDGDLSTTSGNPLAETVLQIFAQDVGNVIWNDQPGSRAPDTPIVEDFHAHAKGVIGFDESGGFYLMHSTPNFPDNPADSEYQDMQICTSSHSHGTRLVASSFKSTRDGPQVGVALSGISNCILDGSRCAKNLGQFKNGQSYLCMTLDGSNLDAVAAVLRGEYLVQYGGNKAGLTDDLPNVAALIDQNTQDTEAKVFGKPFSTKGGQKFLLFGMSPSDEEHPVYLYEELIEPTLKAGLKVNTWTQAKRFPTYCPSGCQPGGPTHDVFKETINVQYVKIPNTDLEWRAASFGPGRGNQDHSKWAITIPATSPSRNRKVLCFADINRAGSQLIRGGGAACFVDNPGMWKLFNSIIDQEEDCQATCPPPRGAENNTTEISSS